MNGRGEDRKHWSEVAEEWLAWARKPNYDAFWAYRAAFAAFIGRGTARRWTWVAERGASRVS
jgi:hypothetical protein